MDFIILICTIFLVHFGYHLILKLFTVEFRTYLKSNQSTGLFNLKLISYFILVYFLYKNDIVNLDSGIFSSAKVRLFISGLIFSKIVHSIIVYFVCNTAIFMVNSFNDFQKVNFKKPNTLINNYVKVFNFIIMVSGIIFIVSIWMEVRVISLIAGLSTASAVFALIFRDFILGIITSITSANSDLARIGDYIYLDKHNLKGTILDISITTVKIECDDGNITSFPSYWLINDIMKNSWTTKESHIKHISLDFFVSLSNLSKISLFDIEEIIKVSHNFFPEKHIVLSFSNDKYNIGVLNCSFFINLKDPKEVEECKILLSASIGSYLVGVDALLEKCGV